MSSSLRERDTCSSCWSQQPGSGRSCGAHGGQTWTRHQLSNSLLDWLGDELRAWHDVRAVARHYRHSGSRLRLIHNLQEGAQSLGRPSPAIGFPPYELQPLDGALARASCDAAARGEISAGHDDSSTWARSSATIAPTSASECSLTSKAGGRRSPRRRSRAADAPRPIRRLCDEHAALWKLLELWTEADESGAANARTRLRGAGQTHAGPMAQHVPRFSSVFRAFEVTRRHRHAGRTARLGTFDRACGLDQRLGRSAAGFQASAQRWVTAAHGVCQSPPRSPPCSAGHPAGNAGEDPRQRARRRLQADRRHHELHRWQPAGGREAGRHLGGRADQFRAVPLRAPIAGQRPCRVRRRSPVLL